MPLIVSTEISVVRKNWLAKNGSPRYVSLLNYSTSALHSFTRQIFFLVLGAFLFSLSLSLSASAARLDAGPRFLSARRERKKERKTRLDTRLGKATLSNVKWREGRA